MNPFYSWVWAGFECTYSLAENKRRFDLLAASKHDTLCLEDYKLISQQGIKTVREGLSWHQIDKGNNVYDFSRFEPMLQSGKDQQIQQIWDLNHFDYPETIDPFSDHFIERYAEYAKRCVDTLRKYSPSTLYIVPQNEPSFYAWMCDNGLWAPYQKGKGSLFKKQLIKAAIHAMEAIWSVDKNVQFIHTDPYMYRQPLHVKRDQEQQFCDNFNEQVKFHSWDMLAGIKNPELGGNLKYMNYVGINYYFYNQQFVGITKDNQFQFRSISLTHKKRLPLHAILNEVRDRYRAPVIITETGSYRQRRIEWWNYMIDEVNKAREKNIPLYGVCAYPILDIPKGAGFIVPQSGLWDFDQADATCKRYPFTPSLTKIKEWNSMVQLDMKG